MSNSIIEHIKLKAPKKVEYTVFYDTPKAQRKFIERTKRLIRSSKEYKDYIKYLKENLDLDRCVFFSDLKTSHGTKVKVEIHHELFTLEDIVTIVINKLMDNGIELNEFIVADEIMELHYKDMVCLVPLSKTIHELAHSNSDNRIDIPLQLTYGNYSKFIEEYYDYMDDDIKTKMELKIAKSKELTKEDYNMLLVKFQYLDVEGVEEVHHIIDENNNVA